MGCYQSSPTKRDISLDRGMSFLSEIKYLKKRKISSLDHEDKVILNYHLPTFERVTSLESEEMKGLFYILKKYILLPSTFEKILDIFNNNFYTFFKKKKFSVFPGEDFLILSRNTIPKEKIDSNFFTNENKKIEKFSLIFLAIYNKIKYFEFGEEFSRKRGDFKKYYVDGLRDKLNKNQSLIYKL